MRLLLYLFSLWSFAALGSSLLPAPCTSVACFKSLIPKDLDASGIKQWEQSSGFSGEPLPLTSPSFWLGLGAAGRSSLWSLLGHVAPSQDAT